MPDVLLFGPHGRFSDDETTRAAIARLKLGTGTVMALTDAVLDLGFMQLTSHAGAVAFEKNDKGCWEALE